VCSGTRVLYIETCDGRCCCSLTLRTDCLSRRTYRLEFSQSSLSSHYFNRIQSHFASDSVHRQHDSLVPSTSSVQQRRRQPWTSTTSSVNLVQLRRSYRHARHYFTPLRSPHCTVRLPVVFGDRDTTQCMVFWHLENDTAGCIWFNAGHRRLISAYLRLQLLCLRHYQQTVSQRVASALFLLFFYWQQCTCCYCQNPAARSSCHLPLTMHVCTRLFVSIQLQLINCEPLKYQKKATRYCLLISWVTVAAKVRLILLQISAVTNTHKMIF